MDPTVRGAVTRKRALAGVPDSWTESYHFAAEVVSVRLQDLDNNWDLIMVGGGITSAGIFREAVRTGLKVLLVEQRDFSWGTSSRSAKLVHCGSQHAHPVG